MSKIGKALLSTAMIAATAATFASTTYAFVVLEKEVHVDDIKFDIETHEGLLVSLDQDVYKTPTGEVVESPDFSNLGGAALAKKNFYQDISKEMLAPIVTGTTYQGITMTAAEAPRNGYSDSGEHPGFAEVTTGVKFDEKGNLVFEKDSLVPAKPQEENPYRSTHEFIPAVVAEDYVKLDLSFRLAHQGEIEGNYKIQFTADTAITSAKPNKDKVELLNSLYTAKPCEQRAKDNEKAPSTYKGKDLNKWLTGETIEVDPRDALRLAIVDRDVYRSQVAAKESGDVDQALRVLEPNTGLGSVAIEGFEGKEYTGTEGKHDKNFNPMYTYHNAVHPFEPFTTAAKAHTGYITEEVDFTSLNTVDLGTFTAKPGTDEDLASYDDLHLTLYLYLEGWDADFFTGISNKASDFTVKLGFNLVKVGE